jgi:large subunit ribosomal protein L5
MARLKDRYLSEVVPALVKQFNYKNIMQVPKIDKIVVNMGVGKAGQTGGDAKELDGAMRDMTAIVGQKPVITRARKSIANFKLREGSRIGCKVTLRGERMYEFYDRLVNIALARIRDFQGVSPNSFDGRGNYALGMREQLTFPEIDYDKIDKVRGMDVIICTTARTDEEARGLLKAMGMPFKAK